MQKHGCIAILLRQLRDLISLGPVDPDKRAALLIHALHDRLYNLVGGDIPEKWLKEIEETFWPKKERGRPPLPAAERWKLNVAEEALTAWFEAKKQKRGYLTKQYKAIAEKWSKEGHALTVKKVEAIFHKGYGDKALSREIERWMNDSDRLAKIHRRIKSAGNIRG